MTDKILPCPICGQDVEIKWIAGMSRDLAQKCGHPFGGQASWYVYCHTCNVGIQGKVTKGTYEEQQKVKKRVIKYWNDGVKGVLRKHKGGLQNESNA